MGDLCDFLCTETGDARVDQVRAGSLPALLAALQDKIERPTLLVTSSLERAEAIVDGLAFFGTAPLIFPPFETLPFETHEPALHISSAQNLALARLTTPPREGQAPPLIVAPADALAHRILPAQTLAARSLRLTWSQTIELEDLAERLVAMGYRRESLAESPGEFAIRGSIVDIFPCEVEWPWRLDFFGDEIEEIRCFDPETQRSKPLESDVEAIEILGVGAHAPKLSALAASERLGTIFDLLPKETLVIIDGPERIHQKLLRFEEVAHRHWDELGNRKPEPAASDAEDAKAPEAYLPTPERSPGDWVLTSEEIEITLTSYRILELEGLGSAEDDELTKAGSGALASNTGKTAPRQGFDLDAHSFESLPAKFDEYLARFRKRLKDGYWVVVVCDNNGQVMRLDELLREHEISAACFDVERDGDLKGLPISHEDHARDVMLMTGQLHEGFECPPARLLVITDREIFGRYKKRHVYRRASRGKPIGNPTEIKRGDYVIHVEHGIGFFERIRRQEIDGAMQEFLELAYADEARLLVPVEKLAQIHKYSGADGSAPALDKLGGKKWQRRCKKTMEQVRKMAGELLELYARRESAEGHAFGAPTVWEQEFAASFIYQETDDQLKAIEEVHKDMMTPKPMDRLVCGDVGYGKTEVAIRAAIKALVAGRQVAVLAPTTLLVHQHFTTFKERFADYPFKIDVLSRFRSAGEVREIKKQLASGEINLVCGTHKLLGKDLRYKDLGLLVVDEEQRFGVAQKERIKSLKPDVDILTLTATPIPRTLHMALAGLRDLSVINTAPASRLPIKTRTIRWDHDQIEEAILRELNRGGQVFFIHNRVQTIEQIVETLSEIVPTAKIAYGHGQMDADQLEKIMVDFIDGKFDIFVSTTIIENGIDIPNVNTIIINRADTFGLAQLYQLRGRVGRDVRQAYAYLILPPGQAITPQAIRRLEALEEFTELGVGFNIAMRDLEIRGAGNILGRDQHGAINDIGFEMYCRLLEEAVAEMRGVDVMNGPWPVEVKWAVDQFLPEDYIPVESQRIRFYKDVAAAREREQLDDLVEELLDRYGPMPPETVNMINAARVKLACSPWQVDTVRYSKEAALVRLTTPIWHKELTEAIKSESGRARKMFNGLKRSGQQVILGIREKDDHEGYDPQAVLAATADFLEALTEYAEEKQGLGSPNA